LAVVLTIALGIGANTAMFSIIHAVLCKPLGYSEPGRVATVSRPQYPGGADPVGADPVGQHILIGANPQPLEIVGIAADVRQGKDQDPKPGVYRPCAQNPPQSAMLAVRTNSGPLLFANAVRNQILAIDPDQPV
jgi:hypothetical protein